jgi:general secretion pathway protein J
MHRRSPLSSAPGFTLIELLVALTLMALLSVILFGGLRFGMRAWETGGHHVEQAGRIEAVQSLLRRQISQARFLPQAADAGPVAPFVGEIRSLMFIAPLPVHRGAGGSRLFRLSERDGDGRSDLTLAWRLYRPELLSGDLQAFDEETILLSDIVGIELSYYGAAGPGRPARWWEAWQGAEGRPQLVRVRVQFPPGDTRRWPDLVIRLLGSPD